MTAGRSPLRLAWARFLGHPPAVAGLSVLVLLAAAAAAAPLVARLLGVDADSVDLVNRLASPSLAHPLGTDEIGRDVLLRLLYGGRVSLLVGISAAITAAALGTAVGLAAGYFGGRVDALLMRGTDAVIALPLLPLAIVLAAVDAGKLGLATATTATAAPVADASLLRIIAIASLFGWTTVARLVRASALVLRQQPFVLAARALGAGGARITLVHILPNLMSPVIVATTLAAGNIILLESVLSFLGLGIQPPLPSWGNLLTNAQELVWTAPALAIYPGALIFVVIAALNFVGDGLRDAFDPRAARL
jgi:peptide/nickel transport system permease protein